MRVLLLLLSALALAACGGGGGGPTEITLSGRLFVVAAAPLAVAQAVAPAVDVEPNNTAACARLLRGVAEGRVGAGDEVDVYRVVAGVRGTVAARVEGEVDAVLHDLETGAVARSLAVEPGSVIDLIVTGAGRYRVDLDWGAADPRAASLPAGYDRCADGFLGREIVVGLAEGVSAQALAQAAGL